MTPPRLARWILSRCLTAHDRPVVLGDLDEEFRQHVVPTRTRLRARAWYWRQVLSSTTPSLALGRIGGQAWRDARLGSRQLRRQPGFALAAVLTLSTGVAVTTAALSIADAVLLRPLPYGAPHELVHLGELDREELGTWKQSAGGNLSWLDFLDYREQSTQSFVDLAGYTGGSRVLTGSGPATRLTMVEVTPGFFNLIGVQPLLGRSFLPEDSEMGASEVVILTHGLWQGRFGGDPLVVGQSVLLSGRTATSTRVIGVLPADFEFPLRGLADIWLPVRPTAAQRERRFYHWLNVIGRLRPGTSVDQAGTNLNQIAKGFAEVDPQYHADRAVAIEPLGAYVVGDVRHTLWLLVAAAGLVFLMGCTNVAGLLLARSAARSREMALKAALGATGARLRRQMVTEGLLLGLPAAGLGVVGGLALVRLFLATVPDAQRASLPHLQSVELQPTVLAFAVGAAVLSALIFGLLPAWRSGSLGEAGRGVVGRYRREARLHRGLVVVQVAVALVLLCGAGLMGRTMMSLLTVSPGFDPQRLFTMRLNLTEEFALAFNGVQQVHDALLDRLAAVPSVTGVATIDQLPLTGSGNSGTFLVEGLTDETERETRVRTVSTNYFDVMGIPLVAGRPLQPTDRRGGPRVLLVNESFARVHFGGQALGRRIAFPFFDGQPYWDIVGVVGDERFDAIDQEPGPVAYFAYNQTPTGSLSFVIRSAGDPAGITRSVRATIADMDPNVPIFADRTMASIIDSSDAMFRRRTVLTLVGLFALAAVSLALIGLFGIVSQSVTRRTREIGVRVTLGASPGQVLATSVRHGLTPTLVGLGAGLLVSLAAARALDSLLFGVAATDPLTLTTAATALGTASAVACLIPARRALRIDPADALRREQ